MVGVNPFRHVPIIKDWLLNMNVRIHAFLSTDPYSEPSINVLTDIVDLRKLVRIFGDLIDNVVNRVGDKLNNATISLLHDFRNITLLFEEKLKDVEVNGDSLRNINNLITSTWKMYVRVVKETGQKLKDALEFEKDTISKNISEIIDNEHAEIGRNIDKIISKVKDQVFSVVKRYTGFGLKFAVTSMTIGGLEITWLDVELVHSVDQLGQCSKFKKVYDLLKGEKSVKLLARSTIKQRLGYFIKVEVSGSFSIAFSIESFKFVTHVHAHVSVLGIHIAADVLLSNHQLYFSIEGNIWNVFLARIELSAKTGKNWDALEFIAKGQLLSRSTDPKSDFQGSYLDGLRMLARKTSENANKRFQAVQDKLSSAQKFLDHAKDKLTSAQEKIRGANGAFDSAVRALGRVKQKLEKAKGPFERAMEKLRRAQRKVDNLCRIRTCHKICVPGVKVKMCKKGWVKYPCVRRSGCMFRVPNLGCELANVACRVVRGLAYVVLEAAKLFVRLPILALDAAKALVSGAQLVVDKSRVVLKLAEGILEVVKLGLDVAKGTIEIAKTAVKGVKFLVGAALHVFELIIKYGLQSILDVKNCQFEIQLTTSDKLAFEVSCEVNAFRTGWHTFEFEFDFRHPLNSMWRMAKSTISSLLNIVKSILHLRKRRDISHAPTLNVDMFFPPTLKNTSSEFNNNKTTPNTNNTIYMDNIETDRVRFFASTCGAFQNIYLLLSESIDTLLSITNESVSTLNDVISIKGMLVEIESNMTTDNMTAENLGISPEYALQDYNITADELQSVIKNINISADPFLAEIVATTTFAGNLIDEQMAIVDDVSIIESWLLSMENITGNYFNESDCIGFEDCVSYAFNVLDDLFHDDTMQNSQINRNLIQHIKSNFQTLVQNISLSILDSYNITTEIQMYLHRLNNSNVFCSDPPAIITDLNNQTVQLGSDIRFICNASGNPTPTIRWYHNDTLIIGQDGTELVLVNATQINEGRYQCVAENIVTNTTSNEAFVEIKGNKVRTTLVTT
jgi:hypothetical protein